MPAKQPLLNKFLHHAQIQSLKKSQGSGGHPDIAIRRFNRAVITASVQPSFRKFLETIISRRPLITPDHLIDLFARTAQYILRNEGVTDYAVWSKKQMTGWLTHLTSEQKQKFLDIITVRKYNVATHIPERYRGLGALSQYLHQKINEPVKIADIGGSGGLGPQSVIFAKTLRENTSNNLPEMTDNTPGQLVINGIRANHISFCRAVNLDVQPVDWEWIYACSYFSKYEESKSKLEKTRTILANFSDYSLNITGDITSPAILNKLKKLSPFHILHASMTTYQMSPKDYKITLTHANALLRENGIFMELTFEKRANWFKDWNVISTIRIKSRGKLTKPLIWLRWDKSRCNKVRPGNDFAKVNRLLGITND